MKHRLRGSVGKGGVNTVYDVKLIQALLNVYLRRESKKVLPIDGKCGPNTLGAIEEFQKFEQKSPKPDGRVDANGRTYNALTLILEKALKDGSPLIMPAEGTVTFNSEGAEGGFYHSRILHVPTETSGLTLGRGYDMKEKSSAKIVTDLTKVNADAKTALVISKASSQFGTNALQLIVDNDLMDYQISQLTQKNLFDITFADESSEAKRVCTLSRIEKLYGKCEWDKLDYRIKEIVIDLKFRGDYTESSRKNIQEHIANNDFDKFKSAISRKSNWTSVPTDRFDRRVNFLSSAEKK